MDSIEDKDIQEIIHFLESENGFLESNSRTLRENDKPRQIKQLIKKIRKNEKRGHCESNCG